MASQPRPLIPPLAGRRNGPQSLYALRKLGCLVTFAEAVEILGVTPVTARQRIREGGVAVTKRGQERLVKRSDGMPLAEWQP